MPYMQRSSESFFSDLAILSILIESKKCGKSFKNGQNGDFTETFVFDIIKARRNYTGGDYMYSPEFRAAALQMVYKSGNIAATARRFQISRNTLAAWIKADRPWWHRPAAPNLDEFFDDYDNKEVEQ